MPACSAGYVMVGQHMYRTLLRMYLFAVFDLQAAALAPAMHATGESRSALEQSRLCQHVLRRRARTRVGV